MGVLTRWKTTPCSPVLNASHQLLRAKIFSVEDENKQLRAETQEIKQSRDNKINWQGDAVNNTIEGITKRKFRKESIAVFELSDTHNGGENNFI